MIRPTSLILLVAAAAAGGALFHVSFEVSELDDRLADLNREIRNDREAIHVLKAEWSFLNQPERLEELARRHLDLLPVAGAQLTGAGALPVRPEREDPVPTIETGDPDAARSISLAAGAPRAKPAVPEKAATVSTVSSPTPPKQVPAAPAPRRSLEDLLREVAGETAAATKVSAQ